MIPRDCKRLAEVDFPVSAVSKHAAREKSIRHGHPSTLHLWWARRPLASSRAVLLALLLPDPCDPHCPDAVKREATGILGAVRQPPADDAELRKALLWFIGAFANWDMAVHQTYLNVGRNLVRAAHDAETPLVVDPFAAGGSNPLEALRLGCEAFASDLNPTVSPEDVMFEADVYLLSRGLAERLKAPPAPEPEPPPRSDGSGDDPAAPGTGPALPPGPEPPTPPEPPVRKTLRVHGDIPPEVWNRVGTRLLPKAPLRWRAQDRRDIRADRQRPRSRCSAGRPEADPRRPAAHGARTD